MPYKNPNDQRVAQRLYQRRYRQRQKHTRVSSITAEEMATALASRSTGTRRVPLVPREDGGPLQGADTDPGLADTGLRVVDTSSQKVGQAEPGSGAVFFSEGLTRETRVRKPRKVSVNHTNALAQILVRDVPTDNLFSELEIDIFKAHVRLHGDWELAVRIAGIPLPAIRHRLEQGKIDFYQGDRTWNAALFRFVDQQAAWIQARMLLAVLTRACAKVRGGKELIVEGGDAAIALAYMRIQKLLNAKVNMSATAAAMAAPAGPPSKQLLDAYERITSADIERLKAKLVEARSRKDADTSGA